MMPLRRPLAITLLGILTLACQADQPPAGLPAEALGVTWQWVGVTGAAEPATVDVPDRYTITFTGEGRAAVRADCNRGSGGYSASADRKLTLGPIALTRMGCPPGSLGDRYVRDLSRVTGYTVRGGELDLELPAGAGALRFRRAA